MLKNLIDVAMLFYDRVMHCKCMYIPVLFKATLINIDLMKMYTFFVSSKKDPVVFRTDSSFKYFTVAR